MTRVLFAPHSDDETLFAFYTVMRHQPRIVVCFPSERDYGNTHTRMEESRSAMRLVGITDVVQWHTKDLDDMRRLMRSYDAQFHPEAVWAPHPAASHVHHVIVATAAAEVFGDRLSRYHTYDAAGKVRAGSIVAVEPGWADLKRKALRCYRTQVTHPRARIFYDESRFELDEYTDAPAQIQAPPEPAGALDPILAVEDGLMPDQPVPPIVTPEPVSVTTRAPRQKSSKKGRQRGR